MTSLTGVAVIGAGVAGAICAHEITRMGVPVTLIGPPAADRDFDVLLPAGFPVLGIGETDVGSYTVSFGPDRFVRWTRPGFSFCRGDDLEQALICRAVDSGARHVRGTVEEIEPDDGRWHLTVSAGEESELLAVDDFVLATGAGAGPYSAEVTGVACAQVFAGLEAEGPMLHVAAPDNTNARSAPWSIRVVPSANGATATISVTSLSLEPAADLFERALKELEAVHARYGRLEPVGARRVYAINGTFDPQASGEGPGLRIGSAAGLINPFSGDGISHALSSARLAAEAISGGPGAGTRYARSLSRTFVGQMGTAEHAARRYHLAWRMLSHTASQDNPFFAKGRRAALLPGGFGDLAPPLSLGGGNRVDPFVAACSEVLMTCVRPHWPFLASLVAAQEGTNRQEFRPSALLAAAVIACGARPEASWAPIAAAMELAALGMLALTATGPTISPGTPGVDWSSATAILAGDFLLAKGAQLIARHATELSAPFSGWMEELVEQRVRAVTGHDDAPAQFFGALFEFPARIGAGLADADDRMSERLRTVGHECGRAFLYSEDVLALDGAPTRMDTTLEGLRAARLSSLPAHIEASEHEVLRGSRARSAAAAYERAMALLRENGDRRATALLAGILHSIAEPALAGREQQ
ncbi:FAD-dependent oxidoreductase [Amycolatopsis sp. DG1A-15b]|uniref:FAD-dependent oxidoreductase n=1 Tax=Amycolatopsis sp. DG1A-15b TaxID=3052846 RepID=UPI00255B8C30|nr:FAD-dependent oxidoreductase [Amycolatopsis sp. DG1A-15b]WIX91328.1 FAD-dependent oxidoreductase [Amycolatopsis sp. DG1A-15b]